MGPGNQMLKMIIIINIIERDLVDIKIEDRVSVCMCDKER
jgi:hypothetical protein